jgi:hypothetical protein
MDKSSTTFSFQRLVNLFDHSAAWIFAPNFPLHFYLLLGSNVLTMPSKGHHFANDLFFISRSARFSRWKLAVCRESVRRGLVQSLRAGDSSKERLEQHIFRSRRRAALETAPKPAYDKFRND